MVLEIIYFFIIGVIIGSFLNVLITRIPEKQSIVSPPSRCPKCNQPIKPYDNIPILSYIILRGRCRNCGDQIPIRYLAVEVTTGFLFAYSYFYNNLNLNLNLFTTLFFVSSLIVIAAIDYEKQIIPNKIVYFVIPIGIILTADPLKSIEGILIGGAVLGLIVLINPNATGFGDIKLAALIGVFLGRNVLMSIFLGYLTGSIIYVPLVLLKKKSKKDKIPLGTFISLGGIITLLWGNFLIGWYLSFFGL